MVIAVIIGILLGIAIGWFLPPQLWNYPPSLPLGDTAFVLLLIAGLGKIWLSGFSRQRLVPGLLFGAVMLVSYEGIWRFYPSLLPVLYGIALAVLLCGGLAFALHDRFGRFRPAGQGAKSFLSFFGIITGIALTIWSAFSLLQGKNSGHSNGGKLKQDKDAAVPQSIPQSKVAANPAGPYPSNTGQQGAKTERLQQVEDFVFDLINRERSRYGKKPLAKEQILTQIAYSHSNDMLDRSFFSHVNPDGRSAHDRIVGSYPNQLSATGENIWMSSGGSFTAQDLARKMVDGWMNSPGHRKNILSDHYSQTGIGVCQIAGETRATQVFAKPYGVVRK